MKTKIWGAAAVGLSILIWLWITIALPSFRGLEGEDGASARATILYAFTFLTIISVASGVALIRSETAGRTK